MARQPNQKLKLLYLSRIMRERTDAAHGLTLTEMMAALQEYGITSERKSLYDDIENLKVYGYDIRTTRDRYVRYRLVSHTFEPAEIRLLVDAVQSCKFLTAKKSRSLIRKLEGLGSKYEANQIQRQSDTDNRLKTENEEIYANIATLQAAMAENRSVRCVYFEWNSHKQRLLRKKGEEYCISPWALMWEDAFYYLVGYDVEAKKIKHFRVDKMLKVHLTEEKREGDAAFSDFDMALYARHAFGMYGGELTSVRLSVDNSLAGVVFDRFGTGVTVLNRENTFEFSVKVMVSPPFFAWVLGFGGKMKILSPDSVAEQLVSLARETLALYASEPSEHDSADEGKNNQLKQS